MNCDKCEYNKYCTELNYLNLADECGDVRKFVSEIRADAIDKVIKSLEAQFLMQNNPNSKFAETIVLHRNFIDALEQTKEQNK